MLGTATFMSSDINDTCNSSTAYILWYKLIMECLCVFDQAIEGGSWLTPMVHLSTLLKAGRGIGTETCKLDIWFGSVTEHELCCYM